MEYLLKEDILTVNKATVKKHGGNYVPPFNFLKEEPLNYLIEAVQAKMFDQPLYPTISDKAGLYMFNIISNHIFQDGNKRTGLGSALLFLRLNFYSLKKELKKITFEERIIPESGNTNNEILIEFILKIAEGKITLQETQKWFEDNIQKIE